MIEQIDFWQNHGWLFLLGCVFFPRITTLFFTTMTFGVWHILGWIFCPHFMVAFIATGLYWHTDPILCVIAWILAFNGTGVEVNAVKAIGSKKHA